METQPKTSKRHLHSQSGIGLLLLGMVLTGLLPLTACSPSCDVRGYSEIIQLDWQRWEAAVAKAKLMSRDELSNQILTLKYIKNEMSELKIPNCAFKAHAQLLTTMNYGIAWFSDIQAQAPEETVNHDMNNYLIGLDQYHQMLDQLK